MEIHDCIKEKIDAIGEDYDSLKPFMQEYLQKIETIIAEKAQIKENAINTLKTNSFSVSSISKELGCSRTTLYYHNQLLKRYIEYSMDVFEQDNPFTLNNALSASKSRLQEQINLMIDRDISIEVLKQEKLELSKLLREKNKEVARLQTRVNELSAQLHQINISGKNNNGQIIPIKSE